MQNRRRLKLSALMMSFHTLKTVFDKNATNVGTIGYKLFVFIQYDTLKIDTCLTRKQG